MEQQMLSEIISLLKENNRLLNNIFNLFSKYDDSYSEEIINENHLNIS